MTALGISFLVAGFALVCAGIILWPNAPRTEPASQDGPAEFRPILDALDEQDQGQSTEKGDALRETKNGLPNAWEELEELSESKPRPQDPAKRSLTGLDVRGQTSIQIATTAVMTVAAT